MKLLGFLFCTGICIGLTRSQCHDASPNTCALMKQNKPNMCEDPTIYVSICPKYCNKCPLSCYSCHEVDHPTDCNNVTTCQANEECLVGEVLTTDFKLKYRLGCVLKDVCTGLHLTELTGSGKRFVNRKRALELVCCSTDRCNRISPDHHYGLSTITTRITAPTTTTVSSVCQDDPTATCDGDTLQIVCGDPQLAQQFCPKSCGVCFIAATKPASHVATTTTHITTTTPTLITTIPSVCQDDPSSTCDGDALSIVCGDPQLARQFCAKSCGVCSTKPASHVATTTTHITTTTPTLITTIPSVCQDDPSSTCDGDALSIVCGDPQLAKQFCAKSCGVCSSKPASHVATTTTHITTKTPTPITTIPSVCQDDPSSTCDGDALSIVCGDPQLARQFCAKSCGVCSAGTTKHVIPTTKHVTTTTAPAQVCGDDPNSTCELAKDIICADHDLSISFCRKTCGLCT